MKKKLILALLTLLTILVLTACEFNFWTETKEEPAILEYSYSLENYESSELANYSEDPFGSQPLGTSLNCGPEDRYKFDSTINSKKDFVDFIKNNEINQWVSLDNFRENATEYPQGEIDWGQVLVSVKTEKVGDRNIYLIDYNSISVGENFINSCSGFTLKMTNDGHVSVYGCCGK